MADSAQDPKREQSSTNDLAIPPRLQGKLEAFQARIWSVKIAEGALAGLVGLGISYLVIFVIDRFVDTPPLLRGLVLFLGFAVPAIGLPVRWWHWVWQQRTLEQVARLLKRTHPRLGDELLGIVELAHAKSGENSRVLVEAAMKQVDEKVADQSFHDSVPDNLYGRWIAATASVVAIIGLFLFLAGDASQNALKRWVSPWKAIERYTFAQLDPLPEKVIVPFAEPFDLSPTLTEETEWEPESATLRLPGKTKLTADRESGHYDFNIPPQKENADLSVRVGDARHRIEVEPLPRPELTGLEASLRLPDYLRYESETVLPIRGASVAILEGSLATIKGTTSRDLARAESNGALNKIDGAVFSSDPFKVEEPLTKIISWEDVHGLKAKSPLELHITPVEDSAPDIFANQVTAERVVLQDEVVTFDISASDDFGIRELGLEWRNATASSGASGDTVGEKPVASGSPETKIIETRGTFSAAREGVPPQTLQLRAFAVDYLPDREREYSATFTLHVLSNEDHAQWLTEEFGKWFRNTREVYEREQQLYETNKSLRKLTAEELERADNRRKLTEQASAESANSRRLDALTQSGRKLVEEATKNDEFDAARLESWATMMRDLEDIAKKRMPSVSDLLKKASSAPGASPSQASKPQDPNETTSQSRAGDSAPGVKVDKSNPQENSPQDTTGEQKDPGETPPKAPGISDKESTLAENKPEEKETGPAGEKKQSPGALGLPQTALGAAPSDGKEEKPDTPREATPVQEKLDEAIKEQDDLLAEFARVADQLQKILSSLEASTFVKRLKAASRKQTEVAKNLGRTINGGFGLPKQRIEQQLREVGEETFELQSGESKFIYHIQTDLEAYFQRKQEALFENVLLQMKDKDIVANIQLIGEESRVNLSGRSIAASEFWADTLDRWAEELVAASESEESKGGSKDSLPPEIVLQIMKVLQDEMGLRDETREMEATRASLAPNEYAGKVKPLELTQEDLRHRTDEVIVEIGELENANEQFGKELQLLTRVSDIMRDARAILARPETGNEAIAAQTEVIELLLQAKRQNNKGGGGGGSNPGGGGAAANNGASLTDIGPGGSSGNSASGAPKRDVEQSTGKAGRELPEEFRFGLDTYFNALQSN
ncbi:hypothetical protein VSU19_10255 [Verrucomicrobiales bacterium BCK34]|nr:hypothetical protein [Verrucomicrobiales bacterium BCK34]